MGVIQKQILKQKLCARVAHLWCGFQLVWFSPLFLSFLLRPRGNNGAVAVKWCDLLTVISQSIDRIRRGGTEIIDLMESETPVLPSPTAVLSRVLGSLFRAFSLSSARHLKAFSDRGVNTTQPYVATVSKRSHARKTHLMIVTWLKLLSYLHHVALWPIKPNEKAVFVISVAALMLYKAYSFAGLVKSVPGC